MTTYGRRKVVVTLLGALAGLALALLLQQAGLLPFDRLAAFGLPAVMGGAALIMVIVRSSFARTITEWVAITIVVVLVAVAATGVPAVLAGAEQGGSQGYLDGGCTVSATSGVDGTMVTDTSRGNPFDIDPDGTVSWTATSPGPITDHQWDVWVDVGGFALIVADGGDDNADEDTENMGSEPVRPYIDEIAEYAFGDPVGIYLVGGSITGSGGSCEGQAWVRLPGGAFTNAVGQGSTALLLLVSTIVIVLVIRTQRTVIETVTTTSFTEGPGGGGPDGSGPGGGGGGSGGGGSGGGGDGGSSPLDAIGGGGG